MKIDMHNWKEFKTEELFETAKGKVPTGANVVVQDLIEGPIPRITVTNINNGISAYYNYVGTDLQNYRVYENFISVSFLGTVFYHKGKASLDMKVHCLKPIGITLNIYTGAYLVSVIEKYIANTNYSDQISSSILADMSILLPATPSGEPDWQYMENYMREMEEKAKERLQKLEELRRQEKRKIDVSGWGEFKVGELFELERGREASPKRVEDGNIPMINEINESNGIAKHGNSEDVFKGNAITISVNYASNVFYQPDNFIASVNILIIRNEHLNKYNGMFITGVLKEKHKNYDYINKISKDRLENESILLPATPSGDPDWEYMENYMRQMEEKAKSRIEKLSVLRK